MQKKLALIALTLLFSACTTMRSDTPQTNAQGVTFNAFYAQLKNEAKAKGFKPSVLDAAFSGKPAPIPSVVKSENAQPELVRTFAQYTDSMLSADRISRGRENLQQHSTALLATQARTGVSASVVVALWGIETNFGKVQGEHPVIPALITLAWQSPRADYFRKETFAALQVLQKTGKKPAELIGSWAGAMGQCQFMPSSYLAYGTDGNGDGVADIWTDSADVFASAATYLQKRGWNSNTPWKMVADGVNINGVKLNSRGLSEPEPLSYWVSKGFTAPAESKLHASTQFRYYHPQADGPAYLLGPNFSVILSWNNSSYFAWSVLALADTIEAESN